MQVPMLTVDLLKVSTFLCLLLNYILDYENNVICSYIVKINFILTV